VRELVVTAGGVTCRRCSCPDRLGSNWNEVQCLTFPVLPTGGSVCLGAATIRAVAEHRCPLPRRSLPAILETLPPDYASGALGWTGWGRQPQSRSMTSFFSPSTFPYVSEVRDKRADLVRPPCNQPSASWETKRDRRCDGCGRVERLKNPADLLPACG
jgi:hypothetical protein